MDIVGYWTLIVITMLIAIITIYFRKFRFIDFQYIVMAWAVGFALDMLFCKWLGLYSWVSKMHKGFYSFWVCLLFYPAVAIIFLKFRPLRTMWITIYIAFCSIAFTIFELGITRPLGIVKYAKWHILPWSPLGYIIVLTILLAYYKIVEKRLK